jgi:uncharacterized protein (DUF2147 family)
LVTFSGLSISLAGAIALFGLTASAPAQAGWSATGEWARDDGQVRVRLSNCGGKICAVNTWAKDPQGQEKAGDRFIMTLVSTDSSHWTGSAFDPQRKLVYTMDVSLSGQQLTTHGCITGSAMCQTAAWRRVSK